jgi:hypothetical protein
LEKKKRAVSSLSFAGKISFIISKTPSYRRFTIDLPPLPSLKAPFNFSELLNLSDLSSKPSSLVLSLQKNRLRLEEIIAK